MKILILHDVQLPFYGGEKIVLESAELLKDKGHEVRIYYGSEKTKSPLNYINFYSFRHKNRIKKILDEFQPEVVYCHEIIQITESSLKEIKKRGIRIVKILESYKFYCPKTMGIFQDGKVCTKGINKLCAFYKCKAQMTGALSVPYYFLKTLRTYFANYQYKKYVDHFICPAKNEMVLLKQVMDLPDSKIHFLPNIVNFEAMQDSDFPVIKPAQFLFVGRISKEKGIDTAIKAVQILVQEEGLTDLTLKIIGDGVQLGELKAMVKDLGLETSIEFMGRVPNSELDPYYRESIATVVPSAWLEVGPLVALEAMKNARPVIVSNVGGSPDKIDHGINGWLFEMGNVRELAKYMKEICHKPELSRKMGQKGREKLVQEYGAENYYKKLIEVLCAY